MEEIVCKYIFVELEKSPWGGSHDKLQIGLPSWILSRSGDTLVLDWPLLKFTSLGKFQRKNPPPFDTQILSGKLLYQSNNSDCILEKKRLHIKYGSVTTPEASTRHANSLRQLQDYETFQIRRPLKETQLTDFDESRPVEEEDDENEVSDAEQPNVQPETDEADENVENLNLLAAEVGITPVRRNQTKRAKRKRPTENVQADRSSSDSDDPIEVDSEDNEFSPGRLQMKVKVTKGKLRIAELRLDNLVLENKHLKEKEQQFEKALASQDQSAYFQSRTQKAGSSHAESSRTATKLPSKSSKEKRKTGRGMTCERLLSPKELPKSADGTRYVLNEHVSVFVHELEQIRVTRECGRYLSALMDMMVDNMGQYSLTGGSCRANKNNPNVKFKEALPKPTLDALTRIVTSRYNVSPESVYRKIGTKLANASRK